MRSSSQRPRSPRAASAPRSPVRRGTAEAPVAPSAGQVDAEGGLGRIDLVKILSESSARARRREHASAYLREIGLKSATVIIDHSGRKSIWRVLELGVDLDHRRSRSSIAGRAKIESLAGPWTLNFRTYEIEAANKLQLAVSVQGLVPRGLARSLPQLAGLESLDVPVWAEAKLDISNTGEILSGTIDIDAAPGRVSLPWLAATPLRIDGGHLALVLRQGRAPADDCAVGARVGRQPRAVHRHGRAHCRGRRGRRAGSSTSGRPADGSAPSRRTSSSSPSTTGGARVRRAGAGPRRALSLGCGPAAREVSAEGDVADMAGAMQARLDGKIGPMSADTFKALWPSVLAPRSRDWVGKHLVRGSLQGGTFRVASDAGVVAGSDWAATRRTRSASRWRSKAPTSPSVVLDGWPTLEVPRGLVRLEDADASR